MSESKTSIEYCDKMIENSKYIKEKLEELKKESQDHQIILNEFNNKLKKFCSKINDIKKENYTFLYFGNDSIRNLSYNLTELDLESNHTQSIVEHFVNAYKKFSLKLEILNQECVDRFQNCPIIINDNMQDKSLQCTIWKASENCLFNIVKDIYRKNQTAINQGNPNDYNRSPLHYASLRGHEALVELLINYGADVNFTDSYKSSPLHKAAYSGHIKIVEYLLSQGANINARTCLVNTPLHKAVANCQLGTVRFLMEKGADRHVKNYKQQTPLDIAISLKYTDIIEYLFLLN